MPKFLSHSPALGGLQNYRNQTKQKCVDHQQGQAMARKEKKIATQMKMLISVSAIINIKYNQNPKWTSFV